MIETRMLWYWGGWLQNAIGLDRFRIEWFHDYCIGYIWSVLLFVGLKLHLLKFWWYSRLVWGSMAVAEFTWTLIPTIILALVGLHSLDMLYSTSSVSFWLGLVVKVWAHQWYWSYEYSDVNSNTDTRYDSYIKPLPSLELGEYRLLDVDYRAIVPTAIDAILVVTSDDLLHSFSIPTIGVKIDANPARLNARRLMIVIPGLYYGQCSELCGVNHSFMPILIEATSLSSLQLWLILWLYSRF
jgi:cytochrome c oxidase subunit 2